MEWPPIDEPELLERLALDEAGFHALMTAFVGALGRREFTPELYDHALRYPWERPTRSYVLEDGRVTLLDDVPKGDRAGLIAEFARDRHPLVGFGANAAPVRLAAKLAHFPDLEDRTALVLAGDLNEVDVGAVAAPTGYGSVPAALFESPGTAVRAAVLWLTPNQVTQITWTEISYRLGRLEDASFTVDEADVEVDHLFAYFSRFGIWMPDGEPLAMAAIPARERTARALTQEQLLDAMAVRILGPGTRAEDLVRAIFEDMPALLPRIKTTIWPDGRPFPAGRWTPYPLPGDQGPR